MKTPFLILMSFVLLSPTACVRPRVQTPKDAPPSLRNDATNRKANDPTLRGGSRRKPCDETDTSRTCNINVFRVVMDPKNVADVFGRRIGKRFVAVQVTIANVSRKYDFVVHDLSFNLSRLKFWKGDLNKRLSSAELSLLRGNAEKGRSHDPRNRVLNILRATGLIFSAVIGLPVGGVRGSWAEGSAVLNGPLITAYTTLLPDHSVPQLVRLGDSAYAANTVIPRQQSRVVVAFLPQRLFMNKSQRNKFWNDPITVFDEVDFRKLAISVYGVHVVNVGEVPPILTKTVFTPDEAKKFGNSEPEVRGYLLGRFLSGATLTVENDDLSGVTINVMDTPSDRRVDFLIRATAPISSGTSLTIGVAKSEHFKTIKERISYDKLKSTTKEKVEEATKGADENALR